MFLLRGIAILLGVGLIFQIALGDASPWWWAIVAGLALFLFATDKDEA